MEPEFLSWLRDRLSEHESRCLDDRADLEAVARALYDALTETFVIQPRLERPLP